MKAIMCDACKKVVSEKEVVRANGDVRLFELCKDCNTKFEQIKLDYDKKFKKLYEERNKLDKEYKLKLKEMGIDYEL